VVRFPPNFRRPLAAKLWMILYPKKRLGWNDGTDHLYHHAKFGGNRATHVGVRGRSVITYFIFFLKITLVGRRPLWCVVELLPFVGQFRCGLHVFLRKKSFFQPMKQFSKLSLGDATINARMAEKNWKSEKIGAKFLRTLRPFISEMTEKYCILPHVL